MMNTIFLSGYQVKPAIKRDDQFSFILSIEDSDQNYFMRVETEKAIPTVFPGEPLITVTGKLKSKIAENGSPMYYIEAEQINVEGQGLGEQLEWLNRNRELMGYFPINEKDFKELLTPKKQ